MIDERFGVRGREGADIEIIGCTGGIAGGGFLYTNLDTLAVGVVLNVPALAGAGRRPEELIAGLKAHPAIAPLVEGGELKEYSAHLIPEGGLRHDARARCPGMLVAGDAAAMCLAAGIWLEGVNFAIGSGMAAGEVVDRAIAAWDRRRRRPRRPATATRLEPQLRAAGPPQAAPAPRTWCCPTGCSGTTRSWSATSSSGMFPVDNPEPKPGLRRILREEQRRARAPLPRPRRATPDQAWRTFG